MERTSRMDKSKDIIFTIGVVVIAIIYLVLRLVFPETIEFGYDQPKLAFTVLDFIQNPTFIDSLRFVSGNHWGYPSWGPMQILFYVPFFLITKDPLLISQLVSIFNLLSVMLVIYIGSRFFSRTVGIVAGLILATHPWWVIFSRMIYQPTPAPFFVSLIILLTFSVLKYNKSRLMIILIPILGISFQIYYHLISIIAVTGLSLLYNFKKNNLVYSLLGLFLALLIYIPYLNNINSQIKPIGFQVEYNLQNDSPLIRLKTIPKHFLEIIAGGDYEWQLGYAHNDFIQYVGKLDLTILLLKNLFLFIFGYTILTLFLNFDKKIYRLLLFLWCVAPIIFLSFLSIPDIIPIPRYFLVSLPAMALLFGIFIDDVIKKTKSNFVFLIPILVSVVWVFLILKYYSFTKNYTYPQGHLSVFSDSQYLFLFDAIKSAKEHNIKNGRAHFILSNDEKFPKELSIDYATRYLWTNVFNYKDTNENDNNGYYLIDYSLQKDDTRFTFLGRFGPYTLYEFKDL